MGLFGLGLPFQLVSAISSLEILRQIFLFTNFCPPLMKEKLETNERNVKISISFSNDIYKVKHVTSNFGCVN